MTENEGLVFLTMSLLTLGVLNKLFMGVETGGTLVLDTISPPNLVLSGHHLVYLQCW